MSICNLKVLCLGAKLWFFIAEKSTSAGMSVRVFDGPTSSLPAFKNILVYILTSHYFIFKYHQPQPDDFAI
jgi:hypothetical protein